MTSIKATVSGAQIDLEITGPLTCGMVGVPVTFFFDDVWKGLSKTAVFRAGGLTVDVVGVESDATVPWEVLRKTGCTLYVGVYGTQPDGSLVIPTLWAQAGVIQPGADPSGDESADPSLPVWEQVMQVSAKAIHNAIDECHPSLEEGVEKKSSRTYNGKPIYSKAMTMIAPEIKGNTNYARLCDGAVNAVVSIHSTIVRNDGRVYANNEVLRIYVTSTDKGTKLAVEYPADAPGGKYAGAIVRSIIEYTKE